RRTTAPPSSRTMTVRSPSVTSTTTRSRPSRNQARPTGAPGVPGLDDYHSDPVRPDSFRVDCHYDRDRIAVEWHGEGRSRPVFSPMTHEALERVETADFMRVPLLVVRVHHLTTIALSGWRP